MVKTKSKSKKKKRNSGDIREVLKVRMDRSGCFEIRTEIVEDGSRDGLEWTMAYSIREGAYAGDVKHARRLAKRGIVPELETPKHRVCSVGYSPKEKAWAGWSHRAICSFKLGDQIFEERFPGATDKTPFKKHGRKKIENMVDARKAAAAFAAYVS